MEHARYHLVFEGFKPDANKTAVSFALKDKLSLDEAKIGDMMAGRRTVLKQNLDKEQALKLGRELTQEGLIVKAQALAVNQKNSPDEVRKHLLNGGLEQYFASRFRHPSEELDTILSLVILAAFAIASYILLPIIGLLLLLPVLSLDIWTGQFVAALVQTVIALVLFVPAAWLWPKKTELDGLELDFETEELLSTLIQSVANFLDAPDIEKIVLVENPVLTVHQTPLQWVKGKATLELGLPILEALTMQQFAGLLAMRFTPLSSTLYSRLWGLFIQWYSALRLRYKPWAMLLNNWVLPMHDHQASRGFVITKELIGFAEAQRLQRIEKRFVQLNRDWPEFVSFCQTLRIRGTQWSALVSKETKGEKSDSDAQALFRIESPALWTLSTTDGYQKMFERKENGPLFEMTGQKLWQQFQAYLPLAEQFSSQLIRPEALVPPTEAPKKKKGLNAILLNKQASDLLAAQQQMVEQALDMHAKPKKPKDIQKMVQKWRATSANFWPDDFLSHRMFPLAKTSFLTLQTLQQIHLWNIEDKKVPAAKQAARDQQIKTLHAKWLEQISKLPALPLIGAGAKLFEQLQKSTRKPLNELSADEIRALQPYWEAVLVVYWTFIAGQILKPKTMADEIQEMA